MNCTTTLDYTYPWYCGNGDRSLSTIQPDPDIAGIGVIIALLVYGLLVILPAFWQIWRNMGDEYGWRYVYFPQAWPSDFPLPRVPGSDAPRWPNLKDVRRYFMSEHEKRLHEKQTHEEISRTRALSTWIFSLADTQFIMGIAISCAMGKNGITLVHFSIADELTWLDS
jgi:hypothetical protein